jgi:hypothetical protein
VALRPTWSPKAPTRGGKRARRALCWRASTPASCWLAAAVVRRWRETAESGRKVEALLQLQREAKHCCIRNHYCLSLPYCFVIGTCRRRQRAQGAERRRSSQHHGRVSPVLLADLSRYGIDRSRTWCGAPAGPAEAAAAAAAAAARAAGIHNSRAGIKNRVGGTARSMRHRLAKSLPWWSASFSSRPPLGQQPPHEKIPERPLRSGRHKQQQPCEPPTGAGGDAPRVRPPAPGPRSRLSGQKEGKGWESATNEAVASAPASMHAGPVRVGSV